MDAVHQPRSVPILFHALVLPPRTLSPAPLHPRPTPPTRSPAPSPSPSPTRTTAPSVEDDVPATTVVSPRAPRPASQMSGGGGDTACAAPFVSPPSGSPLLLVAPRSSSQSPSLGLHEQDDCGVVRPNPGLTRFVRPQPRQSLARIRHRCLLLQASNATASMSVQARMTIWREGRRLIELGMRWEGVREKRNEKRMGRVQMGYSGRTNQTNAVQRRSGPSILLRTTPPLHPPSSNFSPSPNCPQPTAANDNALRENERHRSRSRGLNQR